MNKKYDVFVSYSHLDRQLVSDIAHVLRKKGVRVWYDRWEMRPGDILRERIISGIEQASNFLVILSENSISSNWVKFELNSAFIGEIEAHDVRVIPAIAGGIDFSSLPLDLRMKYGLDFRMEGAYASSIQELIDLVRPSRRLRQDLLNRLKNPDITANDTILFLRNHTLEGGDQSVQIAAMQGLVKTGGANSICVLAERAIRTWGVKAIDYSINSLAKLSRAGGLLALTSILLHDPRFYVDKLRAISNALRRMKRDELSELVDEVIEGAGSYFTYRDTVPGALATLVNIGFNDILYGTILAQVLRPVPIWAGDLPKPSSSFIEAALAYASERVPGLSSSIQNAKEY